MTHQSTLHVSEGMREEGQQGAHSSRSVHEQNKHVPVKAHSVSSSNTAAVAVCRAERRIPVRSVRVMSYHLCPPSALASLGVALPRCNRVLA